MAGRVGGKVAFVTGAARGQGRAHALRLAEEGADIIALDICQAIPSVGQPPSSPEQLEQTAKEVEALGQRAVTGQVDVRDFRAMKTFLDAAVATLGRLDIVVANAGICTFGTLDSLSEDAWRDTIDVNLTGVWLTCKAAIPHLRASDGGSIIITSSVMGLAGSRSIGHYVAAKHGVVGLMKTMALELGPERIRVNCLAPSLVNTDMAISEQTFAAYAPDLSPEQRTLEALTPRFMANHPFPVPYVEPADMANAGLWLASEEARYVTGIVVPVDAGRLLT